MKFIMKQNDTYPFLIAQLFDEKGVVSLEGNQGVNLHVTKINGEKKIYSPVDILDEEEGKIRYKWKPEDTSEIGIFLGEIEVTFVGGKILTFPNDSYFQIQIVKELL